MSMFHQFHELWVAAGPFSVLGSVLVALIVLLFAWLALKDCPFGWVEARARAGRGFVNVSHRFESEWSAVDVLSLSCPSGETHRALPCDEPVRRVLWLSAPTSSAPSSMASPSTGQDPRPIICGVGNGM